MTVKEPALPDLSRPPLLFGALLKARRRAQGLSQRECALRLGVTRNTVINWEADKSKPDYSLIPALCALLQIRPQELFQMPEAGLDALERRVVEQLRRLEPASRRVVERMVSAMVEEELAGKDRALKAQFALFLRRPGTLAAGVGSEVPEEPPGYVFLRRNHINARADGVAQVEGASMEPVYHSGDFVYYAAADAADPGEDVVVDTEEGAVIKRVASDYTLYSVNPSLPYPRRNEQNTLVIRGRVLGVVSSSDRPAQGDLAALEELFAEEIRDFRRAHGAG